jgi:hypothetical protein
VEQGIIEFLAIEHFFNKAIDLFFDFPKNNILHDLVLKLFMIVCGLEEDMLCEIALECNLLDKIGSVWEKFCYSNENIAYDGLGRQAFEKAVSSSRLVQGKSVSYCCFFGHIGILSNLLCESMYKEGLKEVVEVSPLWKSFVDPNIEIYNLMMMEVSSF